jgi:hypothetical protein
VAARQLRLTRQQQRSAFEDSMVSQYRSLTRRLPLESLLGKELTFPELEMHLRDFYEYFDLCNEQLFLNSKGQIDKRTWKNWEEGMKQNLLRPAFMQAWEILSPQLDGSFDELRGLINEMNTVKK